MESVTRTIYSDYLNIFARLGLTWRPHPGTTMNELYNVLSDPALVADKIPTDGYLAIGNGGALYTKDGANVISATPIKHSKKHPFLYSQIPFIARPVTNDLKLIDGLDNYRMRVVRPDVNGVDTAFYYLKKIDMSVVSPTVNKRTVSDGAFSSSVFAPAADDLVPTVPVDNNFSVTNPTAEYLVASASTSIILTATEVSEIAAACAVLPQAPLTAPFVVNEFAIVSGVEHVSSRSLNGAVSDYNEAIGTQVSCFIYKFYLLDGTEISFPVDLGSVEPGLS